MSKPICKVVLYKDTHKVEVGGDSVWTTYLATKHDYDKEHSGFVIPLSIIDELVAAEELGYKIEICEVEHEDR